MMSQEALGSADNAVDNHAPIHPAEVGSHSFEQEFTLNLLSKDGDRLEMIEVDEIDAAESPHQRCGGGHGRGHEIAIPPSTTKDCPVMYHTRKVNRVVRTRMRLR